MNCFGFGFRLFSSFFKNCDECEKQVFYLFLILFVEVLAMLGMCKIILPLFLSDVIASLLAVAFLICIILDSIVTFKRIYSNAYYADMRDRRLKRIK